MEESSQPDTIEILKSIVNRANKNLMIQMLEELNSNEVPLKNIEQTLAPYLNYEDVVDQIIMSPHCEYSLVPKKYWEDRNFVLAHIKYAPYILNEIPSNNPHYDEYVMYVIRNLGIWYDVIGYDLQSNRAFILNVLKTENVILEATNDQYCDDPEVILAAKKYMGPISDRLEKNRKFMKKFLEKNPLP